MSVSDASVSRSRLASTAASSQSTQTTSFDDEAASVRKRESFVYPLFSEMAQSSNVPFQFYWISQIFSIVQYLASSFWSASFRIWEIPPNGNAAMRVVQCFIDFGLWKYSWEEAVVMYVVFIVFGVVVVTWHVYILRRFQYTHNFTKAQLNIARVIQIIVTPVILPVYASLAGNAFRQMGYEILDGAVTGASITLFILTTIFTVGFYFLHYVSYGFCCASPVLFHEALDNSWDPLPINGMLLAILWSSFWAPVIDLFASWFVIPFILVCMTLTVYTVMELRYFPFQKFWVNGAFAGMAVAHTAFQIVIALMFFNIAAPQSIFIPLTVGIMVASVIITSVLLKRKRQRMINELSYSAIECEGKPTDAEKRAHFDSLVFHSTKEIQSYLRIGIANNCEMFLDFSFVHYIVENYATCDIMIAAAQILAFFPSQLQFFGYCLTAIQKFGKLPFITHFLVFQMKKVHVMRQSSISKEAASMIKKVRKQSRDAIGSIRNFWVDIIHQPQRLDVGALNAVYAIGNEINGTFWDLTDRYANNQELYEEYEFFLIEGLGNYKEALKWDTKARMLELGRRLDNDYAFKSLVNVFPHYLVDRICDTRGNILEHTAKKGTQSTASQSMSSAGSSNGSTIDQNKLEDIGRNVITDGSMRIGMQISLEQSSISGFTAVKSTSYGMLAVAVLAAVIIMLMVAPIQSEVSTLMDELKLLSDAYSNYVYTVYSAGLTFASHPMIPETLRFNGLQALRDVGKAPMDLYFVVVSMMPEMTYSVSRTAKSHLHNFLSSVMMHREERKAVADMLLEGAPIQHRLDMETGNLIPIHFNKSIRAAMNDMLDACATGASMLISVDPESDIGAGNLRQGAWNLARETGRFEEAMQRFIKDGDTLMHSFRLIFSVCQYALPIVFGVIFLIIQIISLVKFYKKLNALMEQMVAVRQEIIDASLAPISKKCKEDKVNNGASQITKKSNWAYRTLPVVVITCCVINAVGLSVPFVLSITKLDTVTSLLQWYDVTTRRMGSLLQFIGCTAIYPTMQAEYKEELFNLVNEALEEYKLTHKVTVGGSDTLAPITGYDTGLDTDQFVDHCAENPDLFYKFGLCLSLDRQCSQAQILGNILMKELKKDPYFNLNRNEFVDLLVLVDGGMSNELYEYKEQLIKFSREQFSKVTDYLLIIGGVIIGFNVAAAILFTITFMQFDNAADAIRQLVGLLPPRKMLRNARLMNLLTNYSANENQKVLTPAETIVSESRQGVVSVGLDYTVNSVNRAFGEITGMTQDEVIGQNLSVIFPVPSEMASTSDETTSLQILYECLEALKNGSTEVQTFKMRCQSEGGKHLHVAVTVVPMIFESGRLDSFSLLIQDLAQQRSHEAEAQALKNRCDRIMRKIMPEEAYSKIRATNDFGSALFVSNSATVIWVEIQGLQEIVNSMSPSKVLEVLSTIYTVFDDTCSHFPAVHKIRCTESSMIACSGLFDFEDQPGDQAEQAVLTCCELVEMIDEINERLTMNVEFRFGIAGGSRLVGKLLGDDTPWFDLNGDVFEEAQKLCEAGQAKEVKVNEAIKTMLPGEFKCTKPAGDKKQSGDYYVVRTESEE